MHAYSIRFYFNSCAQRLLQETMVASVPALLRIEAKPSGFIILAQKQYFGLRYHSSTLVSSSDHVLPPPSYDTNCTLAALQSSLSGCCQHSIAPFPYCRERYVRLADSMNSPRALHTTGTGCKWLGSSCTQVLYISRDTPPSIVVWNSQLSTLQSARIKAHQVPLRSPQVGPKTALV